MFDFTGETIIFVIPLIAFTVGTIKICLFTLKDFFYSYFFRFKKLNSMIKKMPGWRKGRRGVFTWFLNKPKPIPCTSVIDSIIKGLKDELWQGHHLYIYG